MGFTRLGAPAARSAGVPRPRVLLPQDVAVLAVDAHRHELVAFAIDRRQEDALADDDRCARARVDPETGKIDILNYVIVEDVGRIINPMIVHGQAIGAAAQGIGATILEDLVYDENGQLLTTTLMDYLLPTSTDIPPIESIVLEEAPSPHNPLGVKGAGEGGIVATGAVLANAVSNALAPLGVQVTQLPLSLNRVREWIRESRQSR